MHVDRTITTPDGFVQVQLHEGATMGELRATQPDGVSARIHFQSEVKLRIETRIGAVLDGRNDPDPVAGLADVDNVGDPGGSVDLAPTSGRAGFTLTVVDVDGTTAVVYLDYDALAGTTLALTACTPWM